MQNTGIVVGSFMGGVSGLTSLMQAVLWLLLLLCSAQFRYSVCSAQHKNGQRLCCSCCSVEFRVTIVLMDSLGLAEIEMRREE